MSQWDRLTGALEGCGQTRKCAASRRGLRTSVGPPHRAGRAPKRVRASVPSRAAPVSAGGLARFNSRRVIRRLCTALSGRLRVNPRLPTAVQQQQKSPSAPLRNLSSARRRSPRDPPARPTLCRPCAVGLADKSVRVVCTVGRPLHVPYLVFYLRGVLAGFFGKRAIYVYVWQF